MSELTELLARHGALIVFVNVLLTQLGLPLPALPTLVIAGALAYAGQVSMPLVIGAAVCASLLGDLPWFFAGRRFGYPVLRTLCRIAIEPDSCVQRTERIFERWGPASIAIAKFIPGFATVAPPLAGAMRVGLLPFIGYSALAGLLYAGVPVAAGALMHDEVGWLLARVDALGGWALAIIAALVGAYIAFKAHERYQLIRFLRTVRISAAELRELLARAPETRILDARSTLARQLDPRRIPGAIAIDIDSPEVALVAIEGEHPIVVYCT